MPPTGEQRSQYFGVVFFFWYLMIYQRRPCRKCRPCRKAVNKIFKPEVEGYLLNIFILSRSFLLAKVAVVFLSLRCRLLGSYLLSRTSFIARFLRRPVRRMPTGARIFAPACAWVCYLCNEPTIKWPSVIFQHGGMLN